MSYDLSSYKHVLIKKNYKLKLLFIFKLKSRRLPRKGNIMQLLTFVEVNIRIYRSKIHDIYRGRKSFNFRVT